MKKHIFFVFLITIVTTQYVARAVQREQLNKTVLVTGAAGFIGSNLCSRLWQQGCTVIAVDNEQTGSRENIAHLIGKERFSYIVHDVCNPLELNQNVDWIINLACAASPKKYQEDPLHTIKTNIFGALNLLELAKKHDAVILQSSTSEVYGNPTEHPQRESYWGCVNPIGPRACYDEAKRCVETLFFEYHRQHNVKIKVIRIFNTYGPNMAADDGRVVSNFIVRALESKPLVLYGDGLQTRSFCYVDDLVKGIIAMMCSSDNITGPINLGNPDEYTIAEFADVVQHVVGLCPGVTFARLPQDDPVRRKPDISKAKKLLNWEPKISLQEGLEKTAMYFAKKVLTFEIN